MHYTWRDDKDDANRRKHRLSLAAGIPALEDPNRECWIDRTMRYDEERWITLGMGETGVLYVVTVDYDDDHTHIISVRKAERYEQDWYYTGRP